MSELSASDRKLVDTIEQYYHQLAAEAKKKHSPVKEAAESGIVKIRNVCKRQQNLKTALMSDSPELMEPFFMGCDTKVSKVCLICLNAIQKLIIFEAINQTAANNLLNCLWNLMESGVEELKLLQTITLLITTNSIVKGESLAKALSLCFRLHFTKNSTTNNTASATIRQLVSAIFERVQIEDKTLPEGNKNNDIKFDDIKTGKYTPSCLEPSASDAFYFFQDLVQLVNAEQPFWLTGLTEMTRTFGLELLELIFLTFPDVFYKHQEFSFLLKERVCQLVIKLFSPNTKLRTQTLNLQTNALQTTDKPFWPITVRLMRIVSVLIQKFYTMLITESEIFLSLLVKSLESDKPIWQRSMALEAFYRMIQPNLISCLCRFYDMKPHSSKIFRDIVNALCIYIKSQFLFVDSSTTQSLIASIVNNNNTSNPSVVTSNSSITSSLNPISNTNNSNPAFLLRGVYIPLLFNTNKLKYKPYFIEQLDKLEAPTAPEGHGLSSAFACVLEIVDNITNVIESDVKNKVNNINEHMDVVDTLNDDIRLLHENLLSASCCGILGAFSLLLDASTDEAITELILSKMKKLAGLYGIYELDEARDATLTSICKSSLPPNYSLSVLNLNQKSDNNSKLTNRKTSLDKSDSINITNLISQQNSQNTSGNPYMGTNESSETRQQVIAVGTPLPTQSLTQNTQPGPVLLTSKNLQCMNAILTVANIQGSVLNENSWHIILTTLQHLVWILGLKPTNGGSLKIGRPGTEAGVSTNTLITTAAMSDLPMLSTMLSRLFESSHYASVGDLLSQVFHSSQYLKTESLMHLVNALVKLSQESMDIAYNNREPSLFAVAKLMETAIVNLNRIDVIWKQMTSHFLEVCAHPHIKMREWGVEALCNLVKSALSQTQSETNYKPEFEISETTITNLTNNSGPTVKQFMFLAPLQELSDINHSDIRQKQLDCVLQILQSNGDILTYGWTQIFEIVGAINETQTENLIRLSFQCLQLIIADFLALIPTNCLVLCVDTTAKFGSQSQELNTSLTAIGLLWNIADFLHTNQNKIKSLIEQNVNQNESEKCDKNNLNLFDVLWMALFMRLGDLCTDSRASVRKSSAQTLFATLSTHGSTLEAKTWKSVMWDVLFTLLDRVKQLSVLASSDKITDSKTMGSASSTIIMHHSRNTAQKQWSETQVLVLSGVSRILSLKIDLLVNTDDFYKTWILLLEFIESSALNKNSEVSLSALKCFQEILCLTKSANNSKESNCSQTLWDSAWNSWYNIGYTTTQMSNDSSDAINKNIDMSLVYVPSQAFLTSLIQLFPYLFIYIKHKFTESDFHKLSHVLQNSLSVPLVNTDASLPYMLSLSMSESLTPLQENILFVLETLQKEILVDSDLNSLLPSIFNQYLALSCYAVNITPPQLPVFVKTQISPQLITSELSTLNSNTYTAFGERALKNALSLYQKTANEEIVIKSHILHSIIKTLKISLCLKYSCHSPTTWKLSVNTLLTVLQIGLPVARANVSDFIGIWADLALCFDGFLFPVSRPPSTQTLEEQQFDESLDVKIVELIRDTIMPFASQIPKEFVLQIVSLLNKGSIHSATNSSPVESSRKLREEFARTCFETLLQFSFLAQKDNPGLFMKTSANELTPDHNIGIVNKLAVTSILQRFNDVVIKYVEDERLCPCPLPRHRMAEISFVLKALATLIVSLKKAPVDSVEPHVWDLLIRLYPHIVDCTTSNSVQVNRSLREVLHQYSDLLSPPHPIPQKSLNNGC
ncbi:protein MON2 homolog isoform X2 [Oppia nitens]|uniref:protein MON2 homolog isoform X2 n=1 Tax=Oppia nitens TaxID=1686743 RepID=UPI0023DCCBD4|nr:protein MON2 homolog isoform X2 [Oppia nitens]